MDGNWFLYCITSFTFAVIFSFCYIRHVFTFFERNRIPTPSYPLFPFGNVYDVIFQKTPMFIELWKFYNRFRRKKSSFGGFYVFTKPAVVITDAKQATKVFSSTEKKFFEDVEIEESPFDFQCLRGELTTVLLSKILKGVQKVLPKILDSIEEEEEKEEVNFTRLLDVDYAEILTKELFSTETIKETKGKFSVFANLLRLSYPILERFFQNSGPKKRVINYEKNVIAEILQENGFSNDDTGNFIISLADYCKKINNWILLTLYELSVNPEIQDDLRGEIKRFRKNSEIGDYMDLRKLTFLKTVVYETLRKYPFDTFVCRICKKDYRKDDLNIPKDVLVFVSIFGIHHDKENYIDPGTFDPDRFSEENFKFVDEKKYLPFGFRCSYSFDSLYLKMMIKIALVELLSKFEFSLVRKSKRIEFDGSVFGSMKLKEDGWFKVKKL